MESMIRELLEKQGRVLWLAVLFLISVLMGQVHATDDMRVETPMPIAALEGVGINSMALWSGASRANPFVEDPLYGSFVSHYAQLGSYGLKHVVLVFCVDYLIDIPCPKSHQTPAGLMKSIELLVANTTMHVVVQPKPYKHQKINGKFTSDFQSALESDPQVAQRFVDFWVDVAKKTQHISRDRLSFNVLNEPEFEQPEVSRFKRDEWMGIAKRSIQAIRQVSPDRVILLEGVGKSLFSRKIGHGRYKYNRIDDLLKPLDIHDIVYAFHTYEPEVFIQQAKDRYGSFGRPYVSSYSNAVKADAHRLVEWANRHRVPVMLSETGCIAYVKDQEGPSNNDDCGLYAKDVYDFYVSRGVGVTWWALEKEKQIFNRDCKGDKGCDSWMPLDRVPNRALFEGLRLQQPPKP